MASARPTRPLDLVIVIVRQGRTVSVADASGRRFWMSGITAGSAAKYLASLEAQAGAAIRKLEVELAAAVTEDEKRSLRARIKEVRTDLERKKRAADHSLF